MGDEFAVLMKYGRRRSASGVVVLKNLDNLESRIADRPDFLFRKGGLPNDFTFWESVSDSLHPSLRNFGFVQQDVSETTHLRKITTRIVVDARSAKIQTRQVREIEKKK
jgi:hypothetical protein